MSQSTNVENMDDKFYRCFLYNQIICAGQHKMKFHQSQHYCFVSPRFWNKYFLDYNKQQFEDGTLLLSQTSKKASCYCWNTECQNGNVPLSFVHQKLFAENKCIQVQCRGNIIQRPINYDVKYSQYTFKLQLKVTWQWSKDGKNWFSLKHVKKN